MFDGLEKYKIFSESEVIVRPAFYESGWRAPAEAMVFGMPCIWFDLALYKSYYPKDMVKVETWELKEVCGGYFDIIERKPAQS